MFTRRGIEHVQGKDAVVLLVVVALFAVPAVVLVIGDKPSPFGFQMYSGYGMTTASWTDGSGVEHEVNWDDHVASLRGEIDWTTDLPEQLCDRIDEAVRVEVRRVEPGRTQRREVSC